MFLGRLTQLTYPEFENAAMSQTACEYCQHRKSYTLVKKKLSQTYLKCPVIMTQPTNNQSFDQANPKLWQDQRLLETNIRVP